MSPPLPVICMILKGFPRISETFISNEIRLLENLGFTIVLISMRHPRESFTHSSVQEIKARPFYLPSSLAGNLRRLIWASLAVALQHPLGFCRALRMLFKKLRQHRTTATVKHFLQAGYLVRYTLPGTGVTRLHAHFAHSPTSVAQFAHAMTGLPFGFTGHAKDIYTQRPQALREKIRQASLVITCTEYNRRHLESLGGLPIHRVYHGIDTALFPYRGIGHAPQSPYRILCVARMVEKKGLSTLLRAIALLRSRGVECTLHHIGDGPLKEPLQAEACALGLSNAVTWLGTRTHAYVTEEYSRADVFALACEQAGNGDRDGIPNVLAESMAAGLPVVTTWLSGIPELVEDQKTGLLVAPGTPEAFADALEKMLTNVALRERIIPAAHHKVHEDFNNQRCIQELAKVFREA